MKQKMNSILEALFFPKPNGHMNQDYNNSPYGNGLILIPVPNNDRTLEQLAERNNNR